MYAWATAASCGFALLDIYYARRIAGAAAASSETADLLLVASLALTLLALAAIGLSWNVPAARNLVIASLALSLLGLFAPALLSPIIPPGSALGPALRIAFSVAVSFLAFAGFRRLCTAR